PRSFYFIPADEKGGITDHGLEQQPFVSLRCVSAEFGVVAEMHAYWPHLDTSARDLAIEAESDAFVGLEAKGQGVGIEVLAALGGKQDVGRGPELNAHFARAGGLVFARAQ